MSMDIKKIANLGLKKKIIISLIIFISLVFVIVYFVIFPAIKDINMIKTEIEFQRTELEKKYLRGQNLKNISEKLERAESKLHVLDQVFIQNNEDLKFITTLEEVASKNNISQKINLSASPYANNSFYKVFPLQLFSQGIFSNQINYLIALETLGYYLNIKSLELNSSARGPAGSAENFRNNSLNFLISADTYWQSE